MNKNALIEFPLNGNELAAALERHAGYVSAMKKQGYRPKFAGNRHSLDHALDWLRRHPKFVMRHAYPKSKVRKKPQKMIISEAISNSPIVGA